jgi:hypothetical protein
MEYFDNINKKICAQVLSWEAHLPFIESCFTSVKKLNLYTIMAWDIRSYNVPISDTFPPSSVMKGVDVFLRKPPISGRGTGVIVPFIVQNYLTIPIIEKLGFESVFSLSGDVHIGKPEGFNVMYEMFYPYDLMFYWYCDWKVGTMIYFAKTKALRLIFDWIVGHIETSEPMQVEKLVMEAIKYHGLTINKYMTRGHDYNLRFGQVDTGLMCQTLGLRHIHREDKDRRQLGMGVDTEFVNINYLQKKGGN